MEIKTVDSFNWKWKYKDVALEPIIGALIHGVKTQRVYKLLNTDKWVSREELRGYEIIDSVRVKLPPPKKKIKHRASSIRKLTYERANLKEKKYRQYGLGASKDISDLELFFKKHDINYTVEEKEGVNGHLVKRLIGTKDLFKSHDIAYKKPARKVTVEITRTAPATPEIIPPMPIKSIAAPTVTPTPRLIAPIAPTAINKLARPRCLGSYHYSFEGGRGHVVSYSSKVGSP